MKLKPEKLLWLLVLLPALPFAVNAYLNKTNAFNDAAEGKAMEPLVKSSFPHTAGGNLVNIPRDPRQKHSGMTESHDIFRLIQRLPNWLQTSQLDFAPVINQQYIAECGSCHFAFQPGLLPQRSWEKIMAGLDNHFGDNAELEPQLHAKILNYLVANSAEHSNYRRSQNLNASIKLNETPVQITDTLYFRRKHHELPDKLVKANPETGSFTNCSTCHRHAEQGLYNEHDILIPNKNLKTATVQ